MRQAEEGKNISYKQDEVTMKTVIPKYKSAVEDKKFNLIYYKKLKTSLTHYH